MVGMAAKGTTIVGTQRVEAEVGTAPLGDLGVGRARPPGRRCRRRRPGWPAARAARRPARPPAGRGRGTTGGAPGCRWTWPPPPSPRPAGAGAPPRRAIEPGLAPVTSATSPVAVGVPVEPSAAPASRPGPIGSDTAPASVPRGQRSPADRAGTASSVSIVRTVPVGVELQPRPGGGHDQRGAGRRDRGQQARPTSARPRARPERPASGRWRPWRGRSPCAASRATSASRASPADAAGERVVVAGHQVPAGRRPRRGEAHVAAVRRTGAAPGSPGRGPARRRAPPAALAIGVVVRGSGSALAGSGRGEGRPGSRASARRPAPASIRCRPRRAWRAPAAASLLPGATRSRPRSAATSAAARSTRCPALAGWVGTAVAQAGQVAAPGRGARAGVEHQPDQHLVGQAGTEPPASWPGGSGRRAGAGPTAQGPGDPRRRSPRPGRRRGSGSGPPGSAARRRAARAGRSWTPSVPDSPSSRPRSMSTWFRRDDAPWKSSSIVSSGRSWSGRTRACRASTTSRARAASSATSSVGRAAQERPGPRRGAGDVSGARTAAAPDAGSTPVSTSPSARAPGRGPDPARSWSAAACCTTGGPAAGHQPRERGARAAATAPARPQAPPRRPGRAQPAGLHRRQQGLLGAHPLHRRGQLVGQQARPAPRGPARRGPHRPRCRRGRVEALCGDPGHVGDEGGVERERPAHEVGDPPPHEACRGRRRGRALQVGPEGRHRRRQHRRVEGHVDPGDQAQRGPPPGPGPGGGPARRGRPRCRRRRTGGRRALWLTTSRTSPVATAAAATSTSSSSTSTARRRPGRRPPAGTATTPRRPGPRTPAWPAPCGMTSSRAASSGRTPRATSAPNSPTLWPRPRSGADQPPSSASSATCAAGQGHQRHLGELGEEEHAGGVAQRRCRRPGAAGWGCGPPPPAGRSRAGCG